MIKRIINKLGIYKSYPLKVNDMVYAVPIHKGLGFTHFMDSEPWMDQVLKKLGSPTTRFLDVGVNVGQTLLKWKSLYPKSTYIGFEPNTYCVSYVEDLIRKNGLTDCKLYPFGLSRTQSATKLYLLGNDLGDSSATTIENFRENETRRAIDVKTIPLKSITEKGFDLIKIDVEGAELDVLESIFELDESPIITCEILPVYSVENAERCAKQNAIAKLLNQNSYLIYRIQKQEKISLVKLNAFDIHGDLAKSDYIFVPKSQEAAIIAKFI